MKIVQFGFCFENTLEAVKFKFQNIQYKYNF